MSEAGKRLIEAAGEALAFARGEAELAGYVVHAPPDVVDVRAIRKAMGMTQEVFGERFGFGKARVRDWEQKRTSPSASDRVLLTTIRVEPAAVLKALEIGGTPKGDRAAARKRTAAPRLRKSTSRRTQVVA